MKTRRTLLEGDEHVLQQGNGIYLIIMDWLIPSAQEKKMLVSHKITSLQL